jgi:hypothetical protein
MREAPLRQSVRPRRQRKTPFLHSKIAWQATQSVKGDPTEAGSLNMPRRRLPSVRDSCRKYRKKCAARCRDTLCSCEAYGMRPMYTEKTIRTSRMARCLSASSRAFWSTSTACPDTSRPWLLELSSSASRRRARSSTYPHPKETISYAGHDMIYSEPCTVRRGRWGGERKIAAPPAQNQYERELFNAQPHHVGVMHQLRGLQQPVPVAVHHMIRHPEDDGQREHKAHGFSVVLTSQRTEFAGVEYSSSRKTNAHICHKHLRCLCK